MSTGELPGEVPGVDRARPGSEAETVLFRGDTDSGSQPAAAGAQVDQVASVDEFSRALIEIGLIDPAELDAIAAESAQDVVGLSRALVKAGRLTPYQAAAVYQNKSRGLLIGKYLILDKLGQGGMGVVFKARHRRLGQLGALKILPPSFARDRDAVLRFRREVDAAGRLNHPNLVAARDADEDRGVHFLVMDYVEGRDLDRMVRNQGPMPLAQAIDCVIQAARGLEAAHAQGIIHRDIKPANLMLDNSATVRVLDLGLARIVDAGNAFNKTAAGRLTQSGMYMGTIDDMAPEQGEDSHRVDHRVDIYSLGCTLYYLLIGQEPFPAESVLKRLLAHMERPAPSLHAARQGIPRSLEAAYQKMMAKRPEDRPASMADVVALLHPCKAEALEGPRSRPELSAAFARTTTGRPRRIDRPGIVLIATGAAAVVGAGIVGVVAFRGWLSEGTRPPVIGESKVAAAKDRSNATVTPPSPPEKREAVVEVNNGRDRTSADGNLTPTVAVTTPRPPEKRGAAAAKKDSGRTRADGNAIATVPVNAPPAPERREAIVKKDRDRTTAGGDSTKTDRSHGPQNSRDAQLGLRAGKNIDAKRPASKEHHVVASRFDHGQNDGWITRNDDDSTNATRFIRAENEGSNYALMAENLVNGRDFGWLAPEKYCGHQADKFGRFLKYRIWTDGNGKGMSGATWYVRLRGRAKVIFIDQATVGRPNPRHWKSYRARLDSSGGWKLSTPSGSITPASDEDIREVLSELKDLWILGEYGEGRNHCRLNYVEFGAD